MIYICTHMATVGVKRLIIAVVDFRSFNTTRVVCLPVDSACATGFLNSVRNRRDHVMYAAITVAFGKKSKQISRPQSSTRLTRRGLLKLSVCSEFN